jgi:two-component system, cell cycle sensor histidine kinase and response regulator CckA
MAESLSLSTVSQYIGSRLRWCPEWLRPYVLALFSLTVASVLAVVLLQTIGPDATVLVSLLGDVVFLVSAWLGYGPGIVVCVLITFVVPPLLVPGRPFHPDLSRFALLLVMSLLISWTASSKRRAQSLLREWGESLETRVRERTQSLQDSERRYRLLFDSNPQPMWVYDQNTLAFLTVNATALKRYGYTREEFLSMTLKDIRPEEDVAKFMQSTTTPTTELHEAGPWRHRKSDGQIISVEITEHPIEFEGHSACLVMAIDITERLRLEEQFRQAQRMESIGRLAGGVAHDFNNLLTVINGYSEMLLMDEPHRDSVPLKEIREAGERAADLTKQLLAFSRRQMVQPAIIDLNTIVARTETFLRRLIGDDVRFVTRLDPDVKPVQADPGQVQQIIMNLAINSRDAMPDGGTLIIETSNVVVDETYRASRPEVRPGPYTMLAVTDTGEGMSPEIQARIFEPFFTTKELGKGTGLGLATVYGMVKTAGGWIWVYSEPGSGTTFKVYLPQTDRSLTPAAPEPARDAHGGETILVVEDHDDVRRLALAGLAAYGYSAHGARSGMEALQFCREFPGQIDLVLTDVVMADMNGREVARQVAQLRPASRILYMSGYTNNVIVHQGILDAGVEYLQKPFTPESLARKIREILGGSTGRAKAADPLGDPQQ